MEFIGAKSGIGRIVIVVLIGNPWQALAVGVIVQVTVPSAAVELLNGFEMVVPEEDVFPEIPALAKDVHAKVDPVTELVKFISAVSPEHCGFVEVTVAVTTGIGFTAIK